VEISIVDHSGVTVAHGTTDAAGRYTVTHLAAGTYTVTAGSYDGYIPTTSQTQPVTIGQNETGIGEFGYLAPTAVDLAAFVAKPRDGAVVLRWETTREENVDRFVLMRSKKPKGPWLEIARVPSKGLGGLGATYEYLDRGTAPGRTYWYRLTVYPEGDVLGTTSVTLPRGSFRLFLPSVGKERPGA
jgi:hypothetical protein